MAKNESGRKHSLANAVSLVAALSFLSPVLGLVMEMTLAWRFGASATVDAFRTAYLLIGFGNQVFVGYLLPHLVVPLLAEYRARGQEDIGWRVAMTFGQSVAMLGLLFAIYVSIDPAPLARWLAPGLTGPGLAETLVMLRYFAFAFVAVLWCGVVSGILNVHRVFGVTSLPQPLSNISITLALLLFGAKTAAIPIGVVCGFTLTLVLHARALGRVSRQASISLREALRPGCWREVLAVTRRGIPLLIMVAATIAGTIVQNQAISRLPPGSLAEFGYANKTMGMFTFMALAIATVIFPPLSEAHASGRPSETAAMANRAIQMILILTGPAAAALFVFREPLIRTILARGAMNDATLAQISDLWGIVLFQVCPSCLAYLLFKISFSVGDTAGPAAFTCLGTFLLFAMIPPAVAWFGGRGIIIATVVAAWIVMLGMLCYQGVRFRLVQFGQLFRFSLKLAAVCAAVVPPAVLTDRLCRSGSSNDFVRNLGELIMGGALCGATGFVAARLLGLKETEDIKHFVMSRWAHVTGW